MVDYIQTDKTIHQLSQIIAKANRSFVEKKSDDGHTNMYFDPISRRILGRWIEAKEQKVLLALHLDNFEFQWLNDSLQLLAKVSIDGKTSSEIESEIVELLPKLGLAEEGVNKVAFREKLHYEITKYEFASEPFSKFSPTEIEDWSDYRNYANEVCYSLLEYLQGETEVRIWPHHFDTGIYVKYNSQLGLGFGWAMADSMIDQPYFYFSAYSKDISELQRDDLPDLTYGEWKWSEHWKGAVLTIDGSDWLSNDKVDVFMQEVASFYLK